MSSDAVAIYLLLGLGLAVVIALWARAWGRNPLAWGAIALLMTPFGFWLVAIALAVRGRRKAGK